LAYFRPRVLEGDREFVQEAFRDFRSDYFALPIVQQPRSENTLSIDGETEIVSNLTAPPLAGFLRELKIKSDTDNCIAIAVYLYKYDGSETFTKADIENSYRKALLSKSTNFSRDINANRTKGFVDITGEKKDGLATFHVTQQGIEYVNSLRKP
jgi:hypothetical protein